MILTMNFNSGSADMREKKKIEHPSMEDEQVKRNKIKKEIQKKI